MAKRSSKNAKTRLKSEKNDILNAKLPKNPEKSPFKSAFQESFEKYREIIWKQKRARVRLHQSFKRSYREDYVRKLEIQGLLHHAVDSAKILLKNWKLFLPLIIFAVVFNSFLVGLMSEETYVQFQEVLDSPDAVVSTSGLNNVAKASLLLISTITTGGLSSGLSEVQIVFAVIVFLLLWLISIYLLRHLLAGKKVKLRDGFYNALTPLISTFVVFLVAVFQSIPIFILIVAYSAAVQTDFLSTPFYALVFFIFASLLLILSCYLLSSTLIAMIAVTAPGLYPMTALKTASDLMAGRRIRFIIRLIYLFLALVVIWVIVMLPIITLDLFFKAKFEFFEGWPVVPICLQIMTCLSFVYMTSYLYLYYRRVLSYEED